MPSRPYNSKDVEPVVVQMNREIRTLLTEREAINKRIDAIKKALVGLATLVGDDVLKETLEHGRTQLRAEQERNHESLSRRIDECRKSPARERSL